MRPYLTVLKDSFHEAFASRVLWILLAVSTLVLVALAPLGLQDQRATLLRRSSVSDWPAMIERFYAVSQGKQQGPVKRIWDRAGDGFQTEIVESMTTTPDEQRITRAGVSTLLEELNRQLRQDDFYDAGAWSETVLGADAENLLERGIEQLSPDERVFLNRLLLIAAFPNEIANAPREELHLSYLGYTMDEPLPFNRAMAEPMIKQLLAGVMGFLVGIVAVFVAILVTAPIIPHTFEAGAVDLLLSKPVIRWFLFLVKFFGGCAFILLNAGYFIVGLWLILGTRFGLWSHSLLWCIPLFLFLFVIYYSVSAFAAVLWKNAIVSIVITILFWGACFTVGTAKGLIEGFAINPGRIVTLLPRPDVLTAVNQSGHLLEWRDDSWETILEPQGRDGRPGFLGQVIIGPVFDAQRKQLHYLQTLAGGGRRFRFLGARPTLSVVSWSGGSWQHAPGPNPPAGASWIFLTPQGETLLVAQEGVFRFDGKTAEARQGPKLFGFRLPTAQGDPPFEPLGPDEGLQLVEPFAAAMDSQTGDLVVFSDGVLFWLQRDQAGRFTIAAQREFSEIDGPVTLGCTSARVALAPSDGRVLVLDLPGLQEQHAYRPGGKSEPYQVLASPDGTTMAVVFHNGTLAVLGPDEQPPRTLGRDVSAAVFDGQGDLLVADRGTRVTTYDTKSLRPKQALDPEQGVLEMVYRYGVQPLYTIFPKPGELSNVVSYVLTDSETQAMGPPVATDLRQARVKVDIQGPLWSSLAFVVVTLSLTCFYISRLDL
ncbi:MAG: ABC transporter permease [Planctomycetota bacterium]|nr:ABC transporter permease [Planctomycetota bacterium]